MSDALITYHVQNIIARFNKRQQSGQNAAMH